MLHCKSSTHPPEIKLSIVLGVNSVYQRNADGQARLVSLTPPGSGSFRVGQSLYEQKNCWRITDL